MDGTSTCWSKWSGTSAARVGNDLLIHGAAARSSDEAPVMGVERRGIVSADSYVNMEVEEAVGIPD